MGRGPSPSLTSRTVVPAAMTHWARTWPPKTRPCGIFWLRPSKTRADVAPIDSAASRPATSVTAMWAVPTSLRVRTSMRASMGGSTVISSVTSRPYPAAGGDVCALGPSSRLEGEREGQDLGGPRLAEQAGADGEGPPGVGDVVDEQHGAGRAGEATRKVGTDGEPAPHPREAEGAVAAGVADRPVFHEVERAEVGQTAQLADARGERLDEPRPAPRGHRDDGDRAPAPAPAREHVDAGSQHLRRQLAVLAAEQLAQTLAPAEVAEAGDGATLGHRDVGRDPAAQRHAETVHAGGPLGPRLEGDAGAVEAGPRGVDCGVGDRGVEPRPDATVAPPARLGGVVVEAGLQERHAAAVGALVVDHELLLALAGLRDTGVALLVVGPRLSGGRPAAGDALHRAVDVEHLEEQLEPGAADVDDCLEGHGGQ